MLAHAFSTQAVDNSAVCFCRASKSAWAEDLGLSLIFPEYVHTLHACGLLDSQEYVRALQSSRSHLICQVFKMFIWLEGNDSPLQYPCLGNSMDRGAWWATIHGVERMRHDWVTNIFVLKWRVFLSTVIYYRKLSNMRRGSWRLPICSHVAEFWIIYGSTSWGWHLKLGSLV